MATVTTINAIFNPVMVLMKEVIKEDTRQILQTDLIRMEDLVHDIAFFLGYEEKEPLEFVKIWLQLLQNSLTEANGLLGRRERSCQSCLDCVMFNPRTLSMEIREWKALFNHLYQAFQIDFFQHVVLSGDVINSRVVAPVTELLKDVMKKEEDNPQILQTEPSMKTLLQRMETLLQRMQETTILLRDEADIATLFRGQKNELLHIMRTCFQSLQSSLTEAKRLFDLDPTTLSQQIREWSCLFDLDPTTLSQQIREWSASFDKIYHGFQKDLLQRIVLSGNAINSDMVAPVMELLKDVITKEDNRHILQTDLRSMDSLLQNITILFRDEPDIATVFQRPRKELLEIMKTWFQNLQRCLTEAKGLFDLEPRSTLSQEIRDWKAFFDHLYQGCQNDLLQHIALSGNAINSRMVGPVMELLKDVIKKEDNRHILQIDLKRMESLLQYITTLFREEPDIAIIFQGQKIELLQIMRNCFRLLQRCFTEAKGLFDLEPRTLSQEIRDWKASFNNVYEGFQNDILQRIDLSGNAINGRMVGPVMELLKDVINKEVNRHILQTDLSSMESLVQDITTLLLDEPNIATLFQRPRKGLQDITKTCLQLLRSSLTEAKGLFDLDPTTHSQEIREWSASFDKMYHGLQSDLSRLVTSLQFVSSKPFYAYKEEDASVGSGIHLSFPSTHHAGRLDAQLYARLRYCYDALPNSHVKRCFLYCAMYRKGEEIDTDTLLQMWIGEGLVKSQQGSYLMDIAIARKYLKLLVHRFFFQRVRKSRNLFGGRRTIRVLECIHDMAVYIGQKEENCVFNQYQQNFPEVHDENCSRISVAESSMEHLPTELRCPKLASLSLQGNGQLKELPSEFLLSVSSLRVLNLSGCSQITSIPTSIGQLRMLQFLSLSDVPLIKDLPEQICHVSSLQFLDLSGCTGLTSLPSQIRELTNLKHLNLEGCDALKMIPREMSELASLSRLQLSDETPVSVEMEAPASIWSLKGLRSLTELQVWIDLTRQQDGGWSDTELQVWIDTEDGGWSRNKDGIMGTWSEMRHLSLSSNSSYGGEDLLPDDMQNMKKLQSFMLYGYRGLSLPNCMFEHLEMVTLKSCNKIRELSPLERLPNLKLLKLIWCTGLRELGIGGPNTYVSLQKLVLQHLLDLRYLECVGGTSETGVWNETTLPQLRVLKIVGCPSLKRFPKGMEKLPNLCALIYLPMFREDKSAIFRDDQSAKEWWERLTWEDENMKIKLERIFIPRERAL